MIKIVYYLPSLYTPGGLERIITLKANYFVEHFNYSVTILTSEQQGRKPYYELSEKVKHVDLGVVFDVKGKNSKLKKVVSYPFNYYRFKGRFSRFLMSEKPDITISTLRRELNFINDIKDGSIKIGEFHVTRNSYHSNSIEGKGHITNWLKKSWASLFLRNVSKLTKFVVLTNEEADNWPELNNIAVVNNPLTFYPHQVSNCDSKQIIAVGRFVFQKGFDLLIDAWAIVAAKHPDWNLRIYGGGDRAKYDEQIKQLGLVKTCFLHGAVTNIVQKYLESSVFVLSSRFEGFGMVITEAMSCGVPTVSFSCPCGPKDIIQDKVDGLLVQKENVPDLADKICYLIEHDDVRKEMGRQARINSDRFKMENIAQDWVGIFESLSDCML